MSASGHEADVKQSTGFEFRRERQPDALYKTDKVSPENNLAQLQLLVAADLKYLALN